MNIVIQNWLFGAKKKDAFSIIKGTPLANPFRVGDQNCIDGSEIKDAQGVQMAYMDWLNSMIDQQVSHITDELDRIAYHLIDHGSVSLSCTCGSDYCHGYVIKHLLEEKLS